MRSVYEIQKEIQEVSHRLNVLMLEKKLTLQVMWGREVSAKILTQQAMEKMKND